jgi:hypothetical protein
MVYQDRLTKIHSALLLVIKHETVACHVNGIFIIFVVPCMLHSGICMDFTRSVIVGL